jgi:hypothetical protein
MNLNKIIQIYVNKFRPHAQAELDWFSDQPSFHAAIENASLALDRRGKRLSHQRRLKRAALRKALTALTAQSRALEGARTFDALLKLVDSAVRSIPGIGELYVYDTALRLGAKLNLFPEKIYVHAGTREGIRSLGLDYKTTSVLPSALPREFMELEPHELEDILCIFKDKLGKNVHEDREGKAPMGCRLGVVDLQELRDSCHQPCNIRR